jgi:hypothetical protein
MRKLKHREVKCFVQDNNSDMAVFPYCSLGPTFFYSLTSLPKKRDRSENQSVVE